MNIEIYTSGKVEPRNSNHGGYAILLVAKDDNGDILRAKSITGYKFGATAYTMQTVAVDEGLKALTSACDNLTVYSRNMTLVNTLNGTYQASKGKELITITQTEMAKHGNISVKFMSKQDMSTSLFMQEADKLAIEACKKGSVNE